MSTYQGRKTAVKGQGFTIIEVMIVLAIAGLILLIVFLAVPALQRNARNTQRKEDAAALLAAVNEYANNNGGVMPTSIVTPVVAPNVTVGTSGAQSLAKVGYYTTNGAVAGGIQFYSTYTATATPANAAIDSVVIETGTTCTNATTPAQGSARQVVAVYGLETANGYTWNCQGS